MQIVRFLYDVFDDDVSVLIDESIIFFVIRIND